MTFRRLISPLLPVLQNHRGAVALEFGLLAPFLLLPLLGGVVDLGLGFREKMQLEAAARAGMEYARFSTDTAKIIAAVKGATGLDPSKVTATVTAFCECSNGTQVSCSSGACSGPKGTYVDISVRKAYEPFMPVPLGPSVYTLEGKAIGRVK